jgi:hypothetical protein
MQLMVVVLLELVVLTIVIPPLLSPLLVFISGLVVLLLPSSIPVHLELVLAQLPPSKSGTPQGKAPKCSSLVYQMQQKKEATLGKTHRYAQNKIDRHIIDYPAYEHP